ncbi:MAG: GatB/YqeY domain-containing protein [Burkholderiaceae bacterium]|nr:MAG: GatB/YqeY domain-containing protein [Burkholderiaceae bacterium]
MTLKEQINEDMKAAMRAKEADRLGAIRMLLAALKQKEVDERIVLDDAAVLTIIEKQIKQRKDSISQFEQAGRTDLVAKEQYELGILSAYMPQQLSVDEIAAEVASAIAQTGAAGPQEMGKVMAVLKPKLAGRADMGMVSKLLKEKLAG